MKKILLLLLTIVTPAFAQWRPDATHIEITEEESALLTSFRANPQPFRQIMASVSARTVELPAAQPGVDLVEYAPRDVIDVTIEGGKVAFYGKRAAYNPSSVRLGRGESAWLVVGRPNSAITTKIRVVYQIDGLHFDVPDSYAGEPAPGFIVIRESGEWNTGAPVSWVGHLDDVRSVSKAENISFRIRYVSSGPRHSQPASRKK